MDAIEIIKKRTSCAQLDAPKPTEAQLDTLYQVAFRAADHRQLKPVRFIEISGEGLAALGELFVSAKKASQPNLTADEEARSRSLPNRAPMIIVAVACLQEDPKVPEIEQILSAGASLQNMLNAAYAMGIGTIWRTGELAFNPIVADGLGAVSSEKIIGFLYIGTPKIPFRQPAEYDHKNHVSTWP